MAGSVCPLHTFVNDFVVPRQIQGSSGSYMRSDSPYRDNSDICPDK